MTGLEQAFYIVGIVFMGIILTLIIALVVAVFVIKSKINKIHDNIENKIDQITSVAEKSGELTAMAGAAVAKKVKKAIKDHKK